MFVAYTHAYRYFEQAHRERYYKDGIDRKIKSLRNKKQARFDIQQ